MYRVHSDEVIGVIYRLHSLIDQGKYIDYTVIN